MGEKLWEKSEKANVLSQDISFIFMEPHIMYKVKQKFIFRAWPKTYTALLIMSQECKKTCKIEPL